MASDRVYPRYRCRGCDEVFTGEWAAWDWEPMARHLLACERAEPTYRQMAQEWLRDNALAATRGGAEEGAS